LAFAETFHDWTRGVTGIPSVLRQLVRMPWERERAFEPHPH
jgi:hypothetical protein